MADQPDQPGPSDEPRSSGEPGSPGQPRPDADVEALRLKRHAVLSTALPFPDLDWSEAEKDTENLKQIRDHSVSLANSTLDWYLKHHKTKKPDRRGCSAAKSGRAKRYCRARRHRLPDGLLANPAVPRSDRLAFLPRSRKAPAARSWPDDPSSCTWAIFTTARIRASTAAPNAEQALSAITGQRGEKSSSSPPNRCCSQLPG